MARRIQLDHSGMAAMLKSGEVRAELTRRAERIADAARQRAPVETGAYRDGIHVEQDTTDRAKVLVVAEDWKSSILEARLRILGSAIDAGRV
jgi:hypothetical protein